MNLYIVWSDINGILSTHELKYEAEASYNMKKTLAISYHSIEELKILKILTEDVTDDSLQNRY